MPKRRLSNFDFTGEGAHVAVTSKTLNGGAANGYHTIVYKAEKVSPEMVDVAKEVSLTLSLQEFLVRWYGLWWDDAEVLARALGFEGNEAYDSDTYISDKVSQISIMKEANDSEDTLAFIKSIDPSQLSVSDYIEMIKFQNQNEHVVKDFDPSNLTQPKSKAEPTIEKGDNTMSEVTIEKSKLELLEKALEEKETLEKAVADLKKAKDEAEKSQLTEIVKGLSFVEEGSQAGLVDVLFAAKDIEKAELILDTLVKAHEAINATLDQEEGFEGSDNDSPLGDEASRTAVEKSVVNALKAVNK